MRDYHRKLSVLRQAGAARAVSARPRAAPVRVSVLPREVLLREEMNTLMQGSPLAFMSPIVACGATCSYYIVKAAQNIAYRQKGGPDITSGTFSLVILFPYARIGQSPVRRPTAGPIRQLFHSRFWLVWS
jgi:hypothetical protein